MKPLFYSVLAMWLVAALTLSSCSSSTAPDQTTNTNGSKPPDSFPPIPRPSTPNEILPDTSSTYSDIVPIEGKKVDFIPTWTAGVFTWDIDVQTQYQKYLSGNAWYGDAPGSYYDHTAHNSALVFENGVVDLRSPTPYGSSFIPPDPFPKRVQFINDGSVLAQPINPDRTEAFFDFIQYPDLHIHGALFNGSVTVAKDPAFGEKTRRAAYYVAATGCPLLTNPVNIMRERFWVRVPLLSDGSTLKSIRVDPGASFSVSYTRTQGTDYQDSYTFTRAINGELGASYSGVGAKLGGSLSEAFQSTVTVQEQNSVTVTRTMTGIEGKTVVYSVWESVEHYTFVDEDGHPYTDPNFTFADLGSADIKGEYEWISSTQFDYQ